MIKFAPYLRIYFLIMSCILNIETSTDVCSVAISDNGQVVFNKEDHSGPNHAVKLGVYVDEALSFNIQDIIKNIFLNKVQI